eukprot:747371-Hanusia_phi.AAC.1
MAQAGEYGDFMQESVLLLHVICILEDLGHNRHPPPLALQDESLVSFPQSPPHPHVLSPDQPALLLHRPGIARLGRRPPSPGIQQQLLYLLVPGAYGVSQGASSPLVHTVHTRLDGEQVAHYLDMPFGRRQVQGCPVEVVAGVGVCPVEYEQLDRLEIPLERCAAHPLSKHFRRISYRPSPAPCPSLPGPLPEGREKAADGREVLVDRFHVHHDAVVDVRLYRHVLPQLHPAAGGSLHLAYQPAVPRGLLSNLVDPWLPAMHHGAEDIRVPTLNRRSGTQQD